VLNQTTTCPTCGAPINGKAFVVDFMVDYITIAGKPYKVTPKSMKAFSVLLEADGVVTKKRLALSLWPHYQPASVKHSLCNEVCRLRKAIAGSGCHIKTHKFQGYSMQFEGGTA
jgi:DNA-binding winged helix-turn-helix (wHTH) protein